MTDDLFDGDIAAAEAPVLEGAIQKASVAYARKRGWWARKFASPANRSVPDYIFGKSGFTLFVEFKRCGKKPTPAQIEEHKAMAAAGLMVHVIDTVDDFKRLIAKVEKEMADVAKALA